MEETFKLRGYTPVIGEIFARDWLEETFKLRGYTPYGTKLLHQFLLEETFKLRGYTPDGSTDGTIDIVFRGFQIEGIYTLLPQRLQALQLEEAFKLRDIRQGLSVNKFGSPLSDTLNIKSQA